MKGKVEELKKKKINKKTELHFEQLIPLLSVYSSIRISPYFCGYMTKVVIIMYSYFIYSGQKYIVLSKEQ